MTIENTSMQLPVTSDNERARAASATSETRIREAQTFEALLTDRLKNKGEQSDGEQGEEEGQAPLFSVIADPCMARDALTPARLVGAPVINRCATLTGETAGAHPGAVVVVTPPLPRGALEPQGSVPDVQPAAVPPWMALTAQAAASGVITGVPQAMEPGLPAPAAGLPTSTASMTSLPDTQPPTAQAPAPWVAAGVPEVMEPGLPAFGEVPSTETPSTTPVPDAPPSLLATAPSVDEPAAALPEQAPAPTAIPGAVQPHGLETAGVMPPSQTPVTGTAVDGQPASHPHAAVTATPAGHADLAQAPRSDGKTFDLPADETDALSKEAALSAWTPPLHLAPPQGVPLPATAAPAAPVVPTVALEAERYMAVQQTLQQGLSTLGTLGVASELQIQLNMANFVRTTLVIRREGGAVSLHCKSGSASERNWFRLNAKELGGRLRHATGLDVSLSVDEAA